MNKCDRFFRSLESHTSFTISEGFCAKRFATVFKIKQNLGMGTVNTRYRYCKLGFVLFSGNTAAKSRKFKQNPIFLPFRKLSHYLKYEI